MSAKKPQYLVRGPCAEYGIDVKNNYRVIYYEQTIRQGHLAFQPVSIGHTDGRHITAVPQRWPDEAVEALETMIRLQPLAR